MKRINKRTARKLYDAGETVTLIAYKTARNSPLNLKQEIVKNANCGDATFDFLVNNYEFYNCNYETGSYCAYYVEVTANDSNS